MLALTYILLYANGRIFVNEKLCPDRMMPVAGDMSLPYE